MLKAYLLLALHSAIIPGDIGGTIWDVRDPTWVFFIQGKYSTH